jgi:hypothetical protein
MAVLQTTYPNDYAKGFPGMISDGEEGNRISRTVEDAAGIAFGKAVFRGAGDHGVTGTPSASFIGIAIANYAAPPAQATGIQGDLYTQYSTAGILVAGQIWVLASANVTAGSQVYVTPAGLFTNVLTANQILTGWFFDDTVSSGAVARIARR